MIILDMPPQVATIEVQEEQSIQNTVFDYFVNEMGLSKAAALGIMANIEAESEFNIDAGSRGGAYGLCQWCGSRRSSLLAYEYSPSLETQLRYVRYELETGYTHVLKVLQEVEDTKDGAARAAHYFCKYYEIPSNAEARANYRAGIARRMWDEYDIEEEEIPDPFEG